MSEPQEQTQASPVEEATQDVSRATVPTDGTPGATSEDKNPDGRGSKREVLADLAQERDKRQKLEAQLKELQDAEEQRKREKMTELERLQADLEAARQAEEVARAEIAQRDLNEARTQIAQELHIPAAMAGRIVGETPEEMRKDAQALAEALGPYTGPADKSAGRGSTNAPPFDLNAAIAAHYN